MLKNHWNKLIDNLQAYYNIVGEVDLINMQNNNEQVFVQLQQFVDYHFSVKERLVVTHIDNGFYLPGQPYCTQLYNLFVMISTLGLPTEHILVITNQDIKKEIEFLSKVFDVYPMTVFASFYNTVQTLETPTVDLEYSPDDINYSYCCINGIQRSSRILMLCELENKSLIDKGMISWNFTPTTELTKNLININISHLPLIKTDSIVNELMVLSDEHRKVFSKYSTKFMNNKFTHPLIYGIPNDKQTRWQPKFLHHALIYLVTETVVNYPYPYLSEKTFKGFLTKRPMLIFGAPGCIAKIKDLGFKTWSDFWNEDYDTITNLSDRVSAITNIIQDISSLPIKELRQICYKMKDVLDYNYYWYVNGFSNSAFNKKIEEIRV